MSGENNDTKSIGAFSDHLWDLNKYGFTLVELILGDDLGLFEVLKDSKKPLTSTEIARAAGLKERYVREWVSAISAAHVIKTHVDDGTFMYSLSDERYHIVKAAVSFGKGIRSSLGRLDLIKTCFQIEGPMGDPSAFGKDFEFFHEYRTREGKTDFYQTIFRNLESVKSLHDKLGERFPVHIVEGGCNVLDIGCGPGVITLAFAKRYPKSLFTGLETSTDALCKAMKSLTEGDDVSNIRFKLASTDEPGTTDLYDVVMLFEVLHNLPDPLKMIADIERLLKPNGKLILLESQVESNHSNNEIDMAKAFQHTISQFYCLPFSMSDEPHVGYGASWGEEAMLKALGKFFILDAHFSLVD